MFSWEENPDIVREGRKGMAPDQDLRKLPTRRQELFHQNTNETGLYIYHPQVLT